MALGGGLLFFFLNNLCKYYPLKHSRFFMQQSPALMKIKWADDAGW
jgi:hypothetical protein